MIAQNPGDRGTRLRAAQALRRLANIRAGLSPTLAERIRRGDADASYAESATLLAALDAEAPGDPGVLEELGRVLSDRGWLLRSGSIPAAVGRAEPALRAAMAIQDRLAAEHRSEPRHRLALAESCVRLSYTLGFAARGEEVEDILGRALRIRTALDDGSPASLEGIAEVHGRLGHLMLATGRVAEGMASLDRALAALAGLASRARSDPAHSRALAELTTRICCPTLCTPALADTLAPYFLRAAETWQSAAADFPGLPEFREGLAGAWTRHAALMKDAGRSADAQSALLRGVDALAGIQAAHPSVRRYCNHLAGLHLRLADCLDESDRPADALPHLERALMLAPDDLPHRADVARRLAVCPDPAGRGPARAIELARPLLAMRPDSGSLWQTLGLARARAGDWAGASEALERSASLRGQDVAGCLALAIARQHRGDRRGARALHAEAIAALAEARRLSHRADPERGHLRRLQDEAAALLGPATSPTPVP